MQINRRSIRFRLLLWFLVTILLTLAISVGLSINALFAAGDNAQKASTARLREQAATFLITLVDEQVQQTSDEFSQLADDAQNVANTLENIFANESAFSNAGYWTAEEKMFYGEDGRYINAPTDFSTVWVPPIIEVTDEINRKIELTAYLDMLFPTIYENNPNTVAVYTVGKEDYVRLYPNIDFGSVLTADVIATEDIYYTVGTPENNPEAAVVWTPVYDDPAGQGLLVTAVAPIYVDGEFHGVGNVDVSLLNLTESIETTNMVNGGYLFLIDSDGRVIAMPEQGQQDIFIAGSIHDGVAIDLHEGTRDEFATTLSSMKQGQSGFDNIMIEGEELFVSYAPVPSTGWSMAVVARAASMLEAATTLEGELQSTTRGLVFEQIIPIGVIIGILSISVGLWYTNRLVTPIRQLAEVAENIGMGRLDVSIPVTGDDEIGILGKALRTTTNQLRQLIGNLEQRVAERTHDLTLAKAEAERASEAKSMFLAAVSHELRTPLNAILNFSGFVAREKMGPVNEEQKSALETVIKSGRHLLNLINDVLDMSRMSTDTFEIYRTEVDLNQAIQEVIANIESLIDQDAVELITDINPQLPLLAGDPIRITQIMLNLVSNAAKFTERGHIKIIGTQQANNFVFSVTDTGPGIEPEEYDAVFGVFRQTKTGLRQGKGTGLGLAISNNLAVAHGGRLWFESEEGQGTTFYLELPFKSPADIAA